MQVPVGLGLPEAWAPETRCTQNGQSSGLCRVRTRAGPADPSPFLGLEHGGSSDSEPQCVDLRNGPGSTAPPGALVAQVAHVGCRDTAEPP